MSESFESLTKLMDSHGMTIADLEYIVKYLIQEQISPQLAMRRIKSFETLKQKLEDTSDQDLIKNLKEQLSTKEQNYKNQLSEVLKEKTSLETKKDELETMSDLFDTEREELRNQLKMLQELQEVEGDSNLVDDELSGLVSKLIGLIKPITEPTALSVPISLILSSLEKIINERIFDFDKIQFESAILSIKNPVTKPVKEVTPIKLAEVKENKSKDPVPQPKTVEKDVKAKIDPQVERVLNLFLDFVREAGTDKDFQNRIDTICEMDEAYEHLGSIGLSQLYSFVSKDLSKKEEFIKLIEAWKVDGVPR